ncbi:unnamed protein product [Clonostachys rhizophaga]|uniref:Uncharacterized protein n=1 Tax=Clonostachys rhizophaga TaxID=160324 RepID=A0A9N9VLT0_9HYPO|nr:unnamed protein product [Clonostachys rhizophaga]
MDDSRPPDCLFKKRLLVGALIARPLDVIKPPPLIKVHKVSFKLKVIGSSSSLSRLMSGENCWLKPLIHSLDESFIYADEENDEIYDPEIGDVELVDEITYERETFGRKARRQDLKHAASLGLTLPSPYSGKGSATHFLISRSSRPGCNQF